MKQVLCLDILIDEEKQAVQQEREVVLTRPWESDASDIESCADEGQTRTRSSPLVTNALLLKDAPLKNTFIHYDVPGSLDADLSPPTTSAPAVLLRRLFKTRAHSAPACAKSTDGVVSEEDSATHVSSLESVDVLPTNVQDAKGPASSLLLKGLPLKNTFIHYDLPGSLDADPAPPTTSAPAVSLHRLFKTAAHSAPACAKSMNSYESEEASTAHLSSLENVDVFPTNVQDAKEDDDLQENLEKASQVSTSAPPSIAGSPIEDIPGMQASFGPDVEQLATELHDLGQCTPCNYFWYKVDGCRQGSACSFCHLCPKGELKKRKKDRLKQLRAAGILRRR